MSSQNINKNIHNTATHKKFSGIKNPIPPTDRQFSVFPENCLSSYNYFHLIIASTNATCYADSIELIAGTIMNNISKICLLLLIGSPMYGIVTQFNRDFQIRYGPASPVYNQPLYFACHNMINKPCHKNKRKKYRYRSHAKKHHRSLKKQQAFIPNNRVSAAPL